MVLGKLMSGVAGDSLRQTTREKHRDPQLLGLGVFEWELQLQSDLLLRTVFPRQGGRKGKKKSLHGEVKVSTILIPGQLMCGEKIRIRFSNEASTGYINPFQGRPRVLE